MNCGAWISSVVVLACLSAHACGALPNLPGPSSGNTGTEPNAADLVREVRASEDWLYRIDSLQFRVEGTWSHSPESIAMRRAELKKQDPNREPDPRYDVSLRSTATDSLEYAIDFTTQRLRYVQNTAIEEHFLQIWDGRQLVCYSQRPDGYEEFSLGLSREPIDRIFGSLSWPRARLHSFWWAPEDVEKLLGYFGRPQDFRLAGRTEYRGTDCYVLAFDHREEPVQSVRWFVGCKDHLLYGWAGKFGEHWTVDYREIAPGCRIPMTQGYTIKYLHPDQKEPYVRLQRDAKIVDVRINEKLPETLFEMEWKEGVYVVDRRSGETVVSKYVAIPPSLIGKPLPDVAALGIDPAAAGKRMLLCFADLNQRPSRHCVTQLASGYEQLCKREVLVVAVDLSEMDKESLSRLRQDQKVPFPVGKVDGDRGNIRRTWGIRSLPWLILTDMEQIVAAEGFSFEELDEKLADIERAAAASVVARCTIRDPNDRPLANACVTIHPMGREYWTDGEGRVSVHYPRPKDADGLHAYVRHKTPVLLCAVGLPSAGGVVQVRLREALSVCGRVTDPQGKPAGGVQIAALPMSDRYVPTDANGCFDIAWDPSWAGGTKDLCLMARDAGRNLAALTAITPETRKADLVLEPGLTLTGAVEDPNARPVPHATVRLSLARGWSCGLPVEPVESDAQGRWQIPALPQRQEYLVSASARGYGPGKATSGRINTTGEVAPIDPILLRPRHRSVSGVVIDVNGLPVEGAGVVLQGEGQPRREATTDRQGRFTLAEICDGTFNLFAARDRDGRRESSGQILNVGPGSGHEIVMFPERKRQTVREEAPFEVDPEIGILKYRWSDRGWRLLDGKDWQRIRMNEDRPLDAVLPHPGYGTPLWGKWCSPAVKGGYRWIALTRAHKRGQYDRLMMDTDGDGRLDDEMVAAAYASSQPSEYSYLTAFGPIEVPLDQSSGPPVVHLNFGFYGADRELIVGSIGWYEGDVNVAGTKMPCLLADKNADGTFATRSSDLTRADLIGLGDEEHRTAHALGGYVALGDGFYEVRIAEGREHVRIEFARAESVLCGTVRLPESINELAVAGANGCFTLHPKEGLVRLPAGTYRIVRWRTERCDEQGRRWTLTGHSFDDSARIEVAADKETSLTVGEPVYTSLDRVEGTAPPYSFHDPKLTGRLGETVDLNCDAFFARLSLRIRAGDGSYDRTFPFEYG